MTADVLILFAGLVCAAGGGELFVRGAVGIAESARIPPGIVGATVAAFATSSPELSVAISSGLSGTSELALGDALGSNVVNIGLVLGAALLVGPIRIGGSVIRRDLTAAVVIPLLTAVLALDGTISRADALALLIVFVVWFVATIQVARRERSAAEEVLGEHSLPRALVFAGAALVVLIIAGKLIVSGAEGLGTELGLDPFVVGVVFVAVGTSTPELATTLIARARGHEEIGLGTVLGSNVFNGAFIVPIAALLSPIVVDWNEIAISLAFGIALIIAVVPFRSGVLGRGRGGLLIAGYGASVVTLLLTHG